jgi:hypothetical protein
VKNTFGILLFLFAHSFCFSQIKKISDPLTPCNETSDAVAGIYSNHTNPKYGPIVLKGTATEKTAMMKNLIAIEKLEEASRKDFNLTGCVARVSFARWGNSDYGKTVYARYGYQLGVYQFVCNVKEHVTKIVDEYRSVFRVDINPDIATGAQAGGIGEFTIGGRSRYEIPIEAKSGPNFENDKKNNPSKVSQYISESMMLANRSSDYKNNHADFLKIINGKGYTENWMNGDKYDTRSADSYQWIDRRYLITKPGVPLLVPVSRKQYLEDMLEYLEIEKANFLYVNALQLKDIGTNTADWAKKEKAILEEDQNIYPKIYEAKKEKIKELLAKQKSEWLNKPAVVEKNNRTYDANKRLENLGKFYDAEDDYNTALYILNPEYCKSNNGQTTKALFMEVQFRYERGKGRGFSSRLFDNWEKNFDLDALRKMLN